MQFKIKISIYMELRLKLLFFVLVNSLLCYSQEHIKLKGKVFDKETNQPIPSASIYIKGQAIGTNTNNAGEFIFNLPINLKKDTLIVSSIGYETFKKRIDELGFLNINISLIPHIFCLKEFTITDKYYTPKQLFKKVRKNYKNNYKCNPYIADTYYREYIKEDSTFVRACEIAMNIYNDGDAKKEYYYPTKIEGVRLSKDYSKNGKLIQSYANELRMINVCNWTILVVFSNLRKCDFVIDSMKYFNGHYVYVVKGGKAFNKNDTDTIKNSYKFISDKNGNIISEEYFSDEENEEKNDTYIEKKHNKNFVNELLKNNYYDYFEFYIDEKDYSIIYFKYYSKIPFGNNHFWIKEMNVSTTFEKINNTYYPKLMKYYTETLFFNEMLSSTSKLYLQMTVNKIKLDTIEPFKDNEIIGNTINNDYLNKYEYDEKFWENYNYFPDDKLRKKVFEDLEILEKQQNK